MKANNLGFEESNVISKKIKELRIKSLKHKKKRIDDNLSKPVAFWIKDDRLLNEIGKEFTVILKTKGCSWALGEMGGCSMCGYVQDSHLGEIESQKIIEQFNFALQNKLETIESDRSNYVLKIFNSGSFFDENEIKQDVRINIYEEIAKIKKIKEVVIESRIEFITSEKLAELRKYLDNKYIEIGIGLETVNDHIRLNYINKGCTYNQFQNATHICQENKIGVKAYLLLKPPFLNESAAIDDCVDSINTLIDLGVNSISINPVNIQKGSLTEYLWYQNRYRPPWFYSLFKCFNKALKDKSMRKTRILCDPSGAGTKRGIHNCLKNECNDQFSNTLEKFILNQNLRYLTDIEYDCDCRIKYKLQKYYS